MRRDLWNKCQECGQIIPYEAFLDGRARHALLTPSSEFSDEAYDTHHTPCPSRRDRNPTATAQPTNDTEAADDQGP